jgi:hypothetical protein
LEVLPNSSSKRLFDFNFELENASEQEEDVLLYMDMASKGQESAKELLSSISFKGVDRIIRTRFSIRLFISAETDVCIMRNYFL